MRRGAKSTALTAVSTLFLGTFVAAIPVMRSVQALYSSVVIGALVGSGVLWMADGQPGTAASDSARPIMHADAVSRVARERARSVVLLHSIARRDPAAEPYEWFTAPISEGLGSGIVIDSAGLILTNAHVIERATNLHVRRPDGMDVPTTVVGTDTDSDLALVRVSDATGLVAAPLGDSDRVEVGSVVVAIGSPLGFHHTVTAGVLSATSRGFDNLGVEFLQTDAAINPGNSGGPLLDLSGRVIGVNTAIVSEGGENVGLNFAIPINTVREELAALRTNTVTHPWLGIHFARLSAMGAEALGLVNTEAGLMITAVESNSPAGMAGVRAADVLLRMVTDSPVRAADVQRRVRMLKPGTTVRLILLRDGEQIEVPVVLGTRPSKS